MEQTASLGCIPMHWLPLGWTDTYPACSCCWGRHTHGPCTALPSAVGILPQTTQRGSSEHFSPTKLLACFPHQCWWIKEPFQEAQFYDIGAKSRCGWKPEGSVIFWRMCFSVCWFWLLTVQNVASILPSLVAQSKQCWLAGWMAAGARCLLFYASVPLADTRYPLAERPGGAARARSQPGLGLHSRL